jgi:hypothetical protein
VQTTDVNDVISIGPSKRPFVLCMALRTTLQY